MISEKRKEGKYFLIGWLYNSMWLSGITVINSVKKINDYYNAITEKEKEIAKLQKEISSLKKNLDAVQSQLPISSENVEELNQFEKIILFKRLVCKIQKVKDYSLREILQNDLTNYSEENLHILVERDKSFKKIETILRCGDSEKGLSEFEKKIFFYMFIEAESSGKLKKKFEINFPEQYRTYSEENYNKTVESMPDNTLEKEREKAEGYNKMLTGNMIITDPFDPEAQRELEENSDYYNILNIGNDGIIGYVSIPKININRASPIIK